MDVEDSYWENDAAYALAMACEGILKAVLLAEGVSPYKTHDHVLLGELCGHYGIKIPKLLRNALPDMKDYEAGSRYSTRSNFHFDIDDFINAFNATEKFIDTIWDSYYWSIGNALKEIRPDFDIDSATVRSILEVASELPVVTFKDAFSASELRKHRR